MLSGDKAEFIAVWLEALLYGIYFNYFLSSIGLLTWRRSSKRINWRLIFVAFGIYVLATGHLIVSFCRGVEAFIYQRDQNGGPLAYYNDLRTALEVSQASTQVAISFLGDSMVIYRVWVVYSRNYWVLILPFLSLIGTTVASITSVFYIGQASSKNTVFYMPKLETWLPAFFALTFSTSILCSLLIVGRLWYIRRKVRFSRAMDTLTTVLRIVIESASIYSLTMLLYLSTYVSKLNVSIIIGDMVSPVIGIAFSLIIVRVHNAFNPDTYGTNEYGREEAEKAEGKEKNKYRVETDRIPVSSDSEIGPLSDPLSNPLPIGFDSAAESQRSRQMTHGARDVKQ